MSRVIHPGNFQCFFEEYSKQLEFSIKEDPENYAYSVNELPQVLERMRAAIERGSFNKDSPTFKRTCKALGIKHTYKAIDEFILTLTLTGEK
jgi:hypothetical protein